MIRQSRQNRCARITPIRKLSRFWGGGTHARFWEIVIWCQGADSWRQQPFSPPIPDKSPATGPLTNPQPAIREPPFPRHFRPLPQAARLPG